MVWTIVIAMLMISSIPTYSWASLRIRREWRLFALAGVALLGAALIVAPWESLLGLAVLYLAMIPVAVLSYERVKRRRASAARPA
jgi:CDP-diacylglycerol--serine O-phosphatidyltransferase